MQKYRYFQVLDRVETNRCSHVFLYNILQNSYLLEPSQYFQFVGGNVRIQGLMSSDSGYFQCIGENAVGKVYGTAQLIVLDEGNPLFSVYAGSSVSWSMLSDILYVS